SRSMSVVPPARNCRAPCGAAAGKLAAALTASLMEFTASNTKGRMALVLRRGWHDGLGLLHSRDDVGVGAAAAEVPAHVFADVRVAAGMAFMHAGDGRHDLARRAVPALEGIVIDECLLHRVEVAVRLGEPLDRSHRAVLD